MSVDTTVTKGLPFLGLIGEADRIIISFVNNHNWNGAWTAKIAGGYLAEALALHTGLKLNTVRSSLRRLDAAKRIKLATDVHNRQVVRLTIHDECAKAIERRETRIAAGAKFAKWFPNYTGPQWDALRARAVAEREQRLKEADADTWVAGLKVYIGNEATRLVVLKKEGRIVPYHNKSAR